MRFLSPVRRAARLGVRDKSPRLSKRSGRQRPWVCPEQLEERWLLSLTPVLTLPVRGGPANAAQPESAQVVSQHVFYNNSHLDGNLGDATAADDAAIATDKTALLPGQTATFANYTSFSRGLNGIMVDLFGLPGVGLTTNDFQFRISNPNSPNGWYVAPAPASISIRAGAGDGGADRVTLIWPDNQIEKQWLEVTVLSTAATGLLEPYRFYYGNAVADSGDNPANAVVNASDEIGARNNPQTFLDPAAIDSVFDFDRDGFVNATDQILARNNSTTLASALELISVPAGGLDPSLPPGQNLDLTKWKITLPVDATGGTLGTAQIISNPQLATYTDQFFYTGSDGAMVFYTPVIGAKSSPSTKYTRTELRELNANGSNAAWTVADGGTQTATVAINQLPTTIDGHLAREVIGQIHGPDDELCRLYYDENGKMYFVDDKSGPAFEELSYNLLSATGQTTQIPLGAKFDYSISVAGGILSVSVTYEGVTYSASETISSFWTGLPVYFKAGLYLGVAEPGLGAGTSGIGAGQVSFYAVDVVH